MRVIGADPEGSVYSGGTGRPYFVEGVGEDMWPGNYDTAVPDEVIAVDDDAAFAMTRRLAAEEGLLVGGSSGMAVVAGLRAARDLGPDDVMVIVLPDSGRGYLGKIFNDPWMDERGLSYARQESILPEWAQGRSRSAVKDDDGTSSGVSLASSTGAAGASGAGGAQPAGAQADPRWEDEVGAVVADKEDLFPGSVPTLVTAAPDTTVAEAIATMNRYGVDALPVVSEPRHDLRIGEVRGTVTVDALSAGLASGQVGAGDAVEALMGPMLPIVGAQASVRQVAERLQSEHTLLVVRGGVVAGIVTLHDLLAYVTA